MFDIIMCTVVIIVFIIYYYKVLRPNIKLAKEVNEKALAMIKYVEELNKERLLEKDKKND